jgi:hypothetical protein
VQIHKGKAIPCGDDETALQFISMLKASLLSYVVVVHFSVFLDTRSQLLSFGLTLQLE